MKKTLIAAFAFLTLTTGVSLAQRVYSRPFDNRPPQYGGRGYDQDQNRDELKIERIDDIVGLSRRQEKQLHKIEDQYDRQMATSRLTPDGYRQLQLRKRQDMMAVLTSAQRDRLFVQQQYRPRNAPYGRRG
ncbi:hypothetical protein [Spirosoma areae]